MANNRFGKIATVFKIVVILYTYSELIEESHCHIIFIDVIPGHLSTSFISFSNSRQKKKQKNNYCPQSGIFFTDDITVK